jgi:hypothetical protein
MLLKIVLLIIFTSSLIVGWTKGFIGLAGSAVYRVEQPKLFWAQMILIFFCLITLIVILLTEV